MEAWARVAEHRHALKQVVYRLRRKLEAEPAFAGHLPLRSAG